MNISMDDLESSLFSDLPPGRTVALRDDSDPQDDSPILHLPSSWPAQLPVALAMDLEDESQILARFGISPERFNLLKPLPAFRKALAEAQRDLRENGHTFKLKARGIAEDYLDQLYLDLHNPTVGITTKVDVFKYLTKVGGLEPLPQKEAPIAAGNPIQIIINLDAPQAQPRQINL